MKRQLPFVLITSFALAIAAAAWMSQPSAFAGCGTCGADGAHEHAEGAACEAASEACAAKKDAKACAAKGQVAACAEADGKSDACQAKCAAEAASAASDSMQGAPAFTLTDTNGNQHSLADFAGKYVVLEWTNPDCPFVKKFYGGGHMQAWQKHYTDQGVVWLTIAGSAEGKQGHYSADEWNQRIADQGFGSTAVLIDDSGSTGRAYNAKTTPHMYIINPDGKLIYQGAIDDNRSADPADIEGANNYVAQVLDAALIGQTQPYGCSVKY